LEFHKAACWDRYFICYIPQIFQLDTITATYADTAILTIHKDHIGASQHLQKKPIPHSDMAKKWRIKVNGAKSVQVSFTTRRKTCPPVILNGVRIPQAENARYLRLQFDRRLNWRIHICTKRKKLGIQLSKMYWMLGSKSQLSIESTLLMYKAILKPIWT